jgi:hypothetical protein
MMPPFASFESSTIRTEDHPLRFREVEKEPSPGQIPIDIGDEIRELAKRQSLSAVMTMLLCKALDRDPSVYGLDPLPSAGRRKKTSAASSATAASA